MILMGIITVIGNLKSKSEAEAEVESRLRAYVIEMEMVKRTFEEYTT